MIANKYYDDFGLVEYQEIMPAQNGDSFSRPVIMRILRILLENGELKKSNLCSKAGLNYKVCARYVNFLAKLRWVEIRQSTDQSVRISIPIEGIETLRKLESESGTVAPGQIGVLDPGEHARVRKNVNGGESKADRKKKVVIIDDDEDALETYSAFLENDKTLEVLTFSSAKKAIEYITLHPNSSDLIILDIRMPGMSGLRLFQAVKAISPTTTIIFLSSLDAAPELSELFSDPKLGNRNFLRKPVSRANFIETVSRAMSKI